MRITSGGNVGIGTCNPVVLTQLEGNNANAEVQLRLVNNNLTNGNKYLALIVGGTCSFGICGWANSGILESAAGTNSNLVIGNYEDGPIIFQTNNRNEKVRITGGGFLGIGTTNPATNLHVVKDSSSPIRMERTGASGGFVDLSLFGAGGSNYFALGGDRIHSGQINDLTTASAANVFIGADSNGITNVLHRSTSSLKYKIDIRDYDKGLDFIKTLRPVYYKGKTDGDKQFAGLIAEEVHASGLEEFVQYAQDGSPDSLAYTHITALLINGIKELKAKIESLEVENDNLKSRLEVLEQS
jgi:hypothetical protein